MDNNEICINICDDYWDDDFVPDGKIQETYAYVESDLDDQSCKDILTIMAKKLSDLGYCADGVHINLVFYDSAEKFPNLVGTEHEYCLYKRWELRFKYLTHKKRERLVEQLVDWVEQGVAVNVYSES